MERPVAREVIVKFVKTNGGKTEQRAIPFMDFKSAEKWVADITKLDQGQTFTGFTYEDKNT